MSLKANQSILDKVEDLLVTKTSSVTRNKLKVLMVGAEVAPFASVGGYSRVLGYLSTAMARQGHDVRIFMPKFGFIEEHEYKLELVCEGIKVPTDNPDNPFLVCNVKKYEVSGRPIVYFLENREYYELRANVYGYADDPVRWALLSRGLLEFLSTCSDWVPDVIHTNDWHTGAVSNYLETSYKDVEKLQKVATVFTIHNLSYQGMYDHKNVSDLDYDDGKSPIANFFDSRLLRQNFMRRGIMYSDTVNAVSPTYAREIMRSEHGEGLDRLLTEVRSKVSGVLNGIDYSEYNPATDRLIPTNFDSYTLDKRVENKIALQREFDLKQDKNIPIFAHMSDTIG